MTRLAKDLRERSGLTEFMVRDCCPSCASTACESRVRTPFADPMLAGFLESHYEGRAQLSRLAGMKFEVDQCLQCGLIFQRTVPAQSLLEAIYDEWIPTTEKERLRESYTLDSQRYLAGQIEFLVQHFGARPAQLDVFDFGFGWAEWVSLARGYGCNVFGTELSRERLEYAPSMGISTIEWDDIPKYKFHFINAEQVFEHLIHPRETLEHLVKAMRPDGLLMISVPDGKGTDTELKRLERSRCWDALRLLPIQPLEHVNCFDHSSLVALGRIASLRPVRPALRKLYNASSGWFEPRNAVRNLLRPIYRHIYPKSTFVYFARNR